MINKVAILGDKMKCQSVYLAIDPPGTQVPEDAFSYNIQTSQLSVIACIPDNFCGLEVIKSNRSRRSREEQSLHLCHRVLKVEVDMSLYKKGPPPLHSPSAPSFEVSIVDRPEIVFASDAGSIENLFSVSVEEFEGVLCNAFIRIPTYVSPHLFVKEGKDMLVDSIVSKTIYLFNFCLRLYAARNSLAHFHPEQAAYSGYIRMGARGQRRSSAANNRIRRLAVFNKPLRDDLANTNMKSIVEHINNKASINHEG